MLRLMLTAPIVGTAIAMAGCGGSASLLNGVPAGQIDGVTGAFVLAAAPPDARATISADQAARLALLQDPAAKVIQTVLVTYSPAPADTSRPRLAWAINFDPLTSSPRFLVECDCYFAYSFILIDAHSADFISAEYDPVFDS